MREQAVVCKNGAQRYRKRSTAGFSDLPRWMAVAIPAPSGAAHDIQTLWLRAVRFGTSVRRLGSERRATKLDDLKDMSSLASTAEPH